VLRAAVAAVDAGGLVRQALEDPAITATIARAPTVDVLAAGKAAGVMASAFASAVPVPPRTLVAMGPAGPPRLPEGTEWYDAGHPLPNEGSLAGARRALDLAARTETSGLLVVLLSGGGSALMALPVPGVTLKEKQHTVRLLLEQGADILELNTVRKHLSAIKGGQLAAASPGAVLTLAVSDVVGDDLSVIASGPTVPDESTFAAALDVLARRGGHTRFPPGVVAHLARGAAGLVPETPKPEDPRLARAAAYVIGPQRGAIAGARRAAVALGYAVHVMPDPVTGEARSSAVAHVDRVAQVVASAPRPLCVLAAGETTVTVVGTGKGGRNQEFAFAMAEVLGRLGPATVAASFGTDGIDGPTDAAGAAVDTETFIRATAAAIVDPRAYLRNNDTYAFFDQIGDLIRTGPTSTNVGDLQVILIG
jgi:glycerate 2-kinase